MKRFLTYTTRAKHIAFIFICFVFLALLTLGVIFDNLVAAMAAGAGFAMLVILSGTMMPSPDTDHSQATERTLDVASQTLKNLRSGLNAESAPIICSLLLPQTSAAAIGLTDREHVLGFEGDIPTTHLPGSRISGPTSEVLASCRMETFVSIDSRQQVLKRKGATRGSAFGIIVPLMVQDKAVGAIKLYYRRGIDIDRTQLAIAEGLGQLLSTQLSSYELDRQAELTARAEVKALQAQINPHFLFNTLNTIASLTRTDPEKARNLLREFAGLYRRTLESSADALIPLSQELTQVRSYLTIEKARFGEKRIIESEHVEAGCEDILVPSFLVQPIVENAVRHAMRDEGPLHIDVHVASDGGDILIAIADDGLGMEEDQVKNLLTTQDDEYPSRAQKGTGIALRNVLERVERFYDQGSGVEILSKLGKGTCVTLKLAGAAEQKGLFIEHGATQYV